MGSGGYHNYNNNNNGGHHRYNNYNNKLVGNNNYNNNGYNNNNSKYNNKYNKQFIPRKTSDRYVGDEDSDIDTNDNNNEYRKMSKVSSIDIEQGNNGNNKR